MTAGEFEALLDLLRDLDVRASFAVIAAHTARGDAAVLLRRAAAEGHQLVNHGVADRPLTGLPAGKLAVELAACQAVLEEAAPGAPRWFRPPSGLMDASARRVVRAAGYPPSARPAPPSSTARTGRHRARAAGARPAGALNGLVGGACFTPGPCRYLVVLGDCYSADPQIEAPAFHARSRRGSHVTHHTAGATPMHIRMCYMYRWGQKGPRSGGGVGSILAQCARPGSVIILHAPEFFGGRHQTLAVVPALVRRRLVRL
jgi:hypothetical protein